MEDSSNVRIACREQQQTLLEKLHKLPALYLSGPSSTGKTLTATTVLTQLEAHFIYINCIELYNPKVVFQYILDEFWYDVLCNNLDSHTTKIDNNPPLFLTYLRVYIENACKVYKGFRLHLIFKHADRLLKNDFLLPFILTLPEQTRSKISLLFISRKSWMKLQIAGELYSHHPIQIHFENYQPQEFVTILSEQRQPPDCASQTQYEQFCKSMVMGSILVQRDLYELIQFTYKLWPKYKELTEKYTKPEQLPILFRKFQESLRRTFERSCTAVSLTGSAMKGTAGGNDDEEKENQLISRKADIELPYYCKYLVIAAYLASFNPSKSDMKFFAGDTGRMSSRGKGAVKRKQIKREDMLHVTGPKPFTKERWVNIFERILQTNSNSSRKHCGFFIQSALTTLTSMQLVLPLKSTTDITQTIPERYIVNINLDLASSLSESIQFDLRGYLYDMQV